MTQNILELLKEKRYGQLRQLLSGCNPVDIAALFDEIDQDEGAAMLGECALIPYDSPINNSGVLFYNTLFDENASCHLALGHGFNECLKGYENYTNEQCKEHGVNDSMIHVDFMIGSKDMSIVGVTKDGERVQIFKDGNWAF